VDSRYPEVPRDIKEKRQLDTELEAKLRKGIEEFKAEFVSRVKR
jgi:F0F1-type ATP synthase alpha subunit